MSVLNATTGIEYQSLSAAIAASSANDVIQVDAGTYVEDFPDITHDLTIQSVGGLAFLSTPSPTPVNGRAVLNVPGDRNVSLTVSGLAISGAVDSANNGAGILFETGNANLTVENSWFYNNQDGILTGGTDAADPGGMNITITNSEFNNNGVDPSNPRFGFDHNLYVNNATKLTVTDSYFHDALGGHEIKSRALMSVIENNRIQDGPTAQTSYSVDLPDGGVDTVSGNVIEKGHAAVNKYLVHFGGESTDPVSSLLMSGNTLVDDRGGAVALFNETKDTSGHTVAASIQQNTLYGFGAGGLNNDAFGPPNDTVNGNNLLPGPGPALDTSHPFGEIACFAAGTPIETDRGPVPVERLRIGDLVLTASGTWTATTWLGRRHVDCKTHPRAGDVWPVRVSADTFGPGQPRSDIFLSPDHAVFVDGALIPIRYLVNGATIMQVPVDAVCYHHVELARHDVILADGLPCESYLDTGNRGAFADGGPAIHLHPDFALRIWDTKGCAPLVLDGERLVAAKRNLLARARVLGHGITQDAGIRIMCGCRGLPALTDGRHWQARLPDSARGVCIASHTWVPAQTRPDRDDSRRLGIAISRIWLDGREVSLESEGLAAGWHAPEQSWRWTDGRASLAVNGVRDLAFEVALTGDYWAGRAQARSRAA